MASSEVFQTGYTPILSRWFSDLMLIFSSECIFTNGQARGPNKLQGNKRRSFSGWVLRGDKELFDRGPVAAQ